MFPFYLYRLTPLSLSTCSYTANLAAHLTATFSAQRYDSPEALHRAGKPLYIKDDYFSRRIFATRFPAVYEDIVALHRFWRDDVEILTHLELGHAIYAKVDAIERAKAQNCSLNVKMLNHFGTRRTGFAMRRDHPWLDRISGKIVEYLADGHIMDIFENYTQAQKCAKPAGSKVPRADLAQMRGLLVVTGIMAVVGVVVTVMQAVVEGRWRTGEGQTKRVREKGRKGWWWRDFWRTDTVEPIRMGVTRSRFPVF